MGHKPSAGHAITDVASSVRDLASAFSLSGGETSPQRCRHAIKCIEDDGNLSDDEQIKIFKLIRKDVTVADMITSIGAKEKRTRYILSELDDL